MPRDIAEGLALALQDAERPGRLGRDVDQVLETNLRGHRQPILDVVMALADHLKVDRENQDAAFGGGGARSASGYSRGLS